MMNIPPGLLPVSLLTMCFLVKFPAIQGDPKMGAFFYDHSLLVPPSLFQRSMAWTARSQGTFDKNRDSHYTERKQSTISFGRQGGR
jgi:hypothetical protein